MSVRRSRVQQKIISKIINKNLPENYVRNAHSVPKCGINTMWERLLTRGSFQGREEMFATFLTNKRVGTGRRKGVSKSMEFITAICLLD